ncbi:MAG TPA: trehalose-phosphatase [Bacteroidales bacterium]|nr:trehalose-phosphatase [Bacteroidales bacterium]
MAAKPDRSLILSSYREASRRILFLDYDGTLVPFSDLPGESILGRPVRGILNRLAGDPSNTVYIISGRDRKFLDTQFNGMNLGMVAEHGYLLKKPDHPWKESKPVDKKWETNIREVFGELTARYPGSFIEEKESSIAYHYRAAGYGIEKYILPVIRKAFQQVREKYPGLEKQEGHKIVEIKPAVFSKGKIARDLLQSEPFDFILAAGDDVTDEDLFKALPDTACSVKIGLQPTRARFRLAHQEQFILFLQELI